MVDYSKWDKMDFSSSDDEGGTSNEPRVTKLDQPSKITTDANGNILIEQPQPQPQPRPAAEDPTTKTTDETSTQLLKTSTPSLSPRTPSSWTERGSCLDIPVKKERDTAAAAAAAIATKLYWSQDRKDVTLRFELSPEIRTKHISLQWSGAPIYHYRDRHTAIGTATGPTLTIRQNNPNGDGDGDGPNQIILDETLLHPIHLPQTSEDDDDDDESAIDWTIESPLQEDERKFLILTLHKAVPMEGITWWWKKPFLSVTDEVDVRQSSSDSAGSNNNNNNAWKDTWEEAHRAFREKIANGELPQRNDAT